MTRPLRYFPVLTLPVLAYISFNSYGWLTFLPVIEAFVLVPLMELFIKPDPDNISEEESKKIAKASIYDVLVYLIAPVQLTLLVVFLFSMQEPGLTAIDIIGRISAMGLMCGVFGINVAHELGHRAKWYEKLLAKILLLTSLYMHFYIEHNRGHHKRVSTPDDPSSARYGESLYRFWIRSIVFAYLSAWNLERSRLLKKGWQVISFHNEMIMFHIFQIGLVVIVGLLFGLPIMGFFVAAAVMGFLQLETVNYIEHYGLVREMAENGNYERVMPHHSWNSDHVVGRTMLFELSRHSDHHYMTSRKYQILRHMESSPQMPTGYPGMMIMALFPPLWFKIMNNRLQQYSLSTAS